ncbi:MAG: FAD-dependent oxidoreductase [Deltaproteobacteria bacterium]|nr:FAD-dependent oxidoreductase [Deltaproteobacteria bacterium]MBN2844481.1 FAD-dependent oxidoreductase [Deltaproteobacteria bacterium]
MAKGKEMMGPPSILIPCSYISTESNKTGAWRFLRPRYEEKTSPCSAACPAGEDIGRIEMLATQGLFKEAWETILWENPFPGVCGRVCYHPCERACNRGEFDEAIAIHTIERFLSDTAARNDFKPVLERLPARKEKIAIIGSGPGGLAGAYFLALLGYGCDVFESMPEPGGVLRWGIPSYRLPLSALRNDVSQIESQGVRIYTGRRITRDLLEDMYGTYDGVFVCCGHSASRSLGIPGENLKGVTNGLDFLRRVREGEIPSVEGLSVIIGGGNTAVDVARSVIRFGGKALIAYRRRRQDMPAFEDEVAMLLDEGVELRELVAPITITEESGEYVLTLGSMKVAGEDTDGRARVERDGDTTEEIRVKRVFKAIGEVAAESWFEPPEKGTDIKILNTCVMVNRPDHPAVVFGGDLTAGFKSVVNAVASGKEAAIALDIVFRKGLDSVDEGLADCMVGDGPAHSMEIHMKGERYKRSSHIVPYEEINTDYFSFTQGITQPRLLRDERLTSFEEVDLKISASVAMRESERCFNCGLCNQCDNCYIYCPDMSVVHDSSIQGRHVDYDYCKGCGICVVECPRNAMSLEEED